MLSKKQQKAIGILDEISNDIKRFQRVYKSLSNKEALLVGGLIVSVYSPLGNLGWQATIGNVIIIKGMVKNLND